MEEAQSLQRQTEAELRNHRDHLEELVRDRTLALSIAKEAAEAANRAKTAFLSKVSHELRTPMNGIMGMTSLALRRTEDPKLLEYLGKLGQSSSRLLAIINNMIDISAIEAERLTLNTVEFELGEVIERVRNLLMPKATDKKLALNIDSLDAIGSWRLLGDSDRFGQILLTLVDNAIKFTSVGSVTIPSRVTQDDTSHASIRIEVQDIGIGIQKEARSRLFFAFEQADNSETRPYGGTGLGLAICKRLAKMMDGDIGVDSIEGVGSTFWFQVCLPVASHELPNGSL
jgi:signal transduction histidine kinase